MNSQLLSLNTEIVNLKDSIIMDKCETRCFPNDTRLAPSTRPQRFNTARKPPRYNGTVKKNTRQQKQTHPASRTFRSNINTFPKVPPGFPAKAANVPPQILQKEEQQQRREQELQEKQQQQSHPHRQSCSEDVQGQQSSQHEGQLPPLTDSNNYAVEIKASPTVPVEEPAYYELFRLAAAVGNLLKESSGARIITGYLTPPQFHVSYSKSLSAVYYPALPVLVPPFGATSSSPTDITFGGVLTINGSTLGNRWSKSSPLPLSAVSNPCPSLPSVPPTPKCTWEVDDRDTDFSGPQRNPTNGRKHKTIESLARIIDKACMDNSNTMFVQGNAGGADGAGPSVSDLRSAANPDGSNALFFSSTVSEVPVLSYLARFVEWLSVSESVFVVTLVYLDRVRANETMLSVTHRNVHRLLTCAITVAHKTLEDEPYDNTTMAKLGGLGSVQEMNRLEFEFLKRLNWWTLVEPDLYAKYRSMVPL